MPFFVITFALYRFIPFVFIDVVISCKLIDPDFYSVVSPIKKVQIQVNLFT